MSTYKKKTGLTFYTIATVVTLVVGTVYEFFSHQVYSPFMYLLFMIPLVLGVVPNLIAKMTGKTFLESEDAQAAYKMGVLTFIFGASSKESRHLRNQFRLPNPLLTSRCAVASCSSGVRNVLQESSC